MRAESLLDAASAVLVEEGYAALSIRRIAARAGVRPGHLQYYYPSKADVVRALLERQLAHAIDTVEEAAAPDRGATDKDAPGGRDRLDRMLGALLHRQGQADTCRLFLELRALAARDPEVAEAAAHFHTRYWRAVVDVVLEVSPGLGRPRAERRAALIVALIEGLMLFRSPRDPRHLPLLGLERELLEVVRTLAGDD